MEEIRTLNDLCVRMRIPKDAEEIQIKDTFKKVADFLINKCCIRCIDGTEFRILDLECYFYNKKHMDISVHPRKSKALQWYINDFGGIDLNFESEITPEYIAGKKAFRYNLTEDSYFGGVLIRQVESVDGKILLNGPLKVAELFRTLDATSLVQQNPVLVERDYGVTEKPFEFTRLNLLGSSNDPDKKTEDNLKVCFNLTDEEIQARKEGLSEKLGEFNEKPYRYTLRNDSRQRY